MGVQEKTAAYKVISDAGGNRYKFYCEVSDALACTTEPIRAKTPEEELQIAWETVGRKHFNLCHKCGRWVIEAMFNADALECVACAPWENTPKYCKFCGTKVSVFQSLCPKCGKHLIYGGNFDD